MGIVWGILLRTGYIHVPVVQMILAVFQHFLGKGRVLQRAGTVALTFHKVLDSMLIRNCVFINPTEPNVLGFFVRYPINHDLFRNEFSKCVIPVPPSKILQCYFFQNMVKYKRYNFIFNANSKSGIH